MNTCLGLEIPIRIVTFNFKGGILDPPAVTRLQVGKIGLEAVALGPSHIKTQQHFGPILRLGAAGAGMDRDDRAKTVVFAPEHNL
jgi:hypothetical protein